jgi:ABC-type nitrate/sulfonate/bicarbonate transport system substrate-binding protein
MLKLTLALDWTPNINHIGFFIAREMGFYKELGLEVDIIDPSSDNYAVTPAKKVELGEADLALCPTESVISYRTKENPFDLIGIATIFQKDISAIAVREGEGITSPKDLDGKSYASYHARYEDGIVKQMIKNDGGLGDIEVIYPEKLGIWDTVIRKKHDSTWIFLNWEGVEADNYFTKLRFFKLADYQIPYSYSPLLVAGATRLEANPESYRAFVQGSKKGFEFCAEHPSQAISILRPFLPENAALINLNKALDISIDAFGNEWGKIDEYVVSQFLEWIYQYGLEEKRVEVSEVVTNRYH